MTEFITEIISAFETGPAVFYTPVYKLIPGHKTHWDAVDTGERVMYRAFHHINGEWVRCEFLGFFP